MTNLHQTITSQSGWLNTGRALKAEDLEGRIILVDFWTYCCINCMHVIPDLQYLEKKFGHDLTVIGVHSAKFKNEKDTDNIRSAILRYGIEHPVVNDFDFSIWNKFGIRAWPTFVLINPKGIIEATYSGEGNRDAIARDIEALREKYRGKINTAELPIYLEKVKTSDQTLKFPTKLTFGGGMMFVADSGYQRILAIPLGETKPTAIIGSGRAGYKDGTFGEAEFNTPQGLLFDEKNELLYIADTNNHRLRVADMKARTVKTLAELYKKGRFGGFGDNPMLDVADPTNTESTKLIAPSSPWDLEFYPDNNHIVIAMAGAHQLWSYDVESGKVDIIAGSGAESINDGPLPNNSLSQPSGLSATGGLLYFVDSETSSLRVYENGEIKTLIGSGLFDFGFKDGRQGTALMQHNIGVFADATGVYIADSYNHSIRRYDPKTGELSTFAGHGVRGRKDGSLKEAEFNEPNDIIKIGNAFYVADTNNHVIRMIKDGQVTTLLQLGEQADPEAGEDVVGKAAGDDDAPDDNLPNLVELAPVEVDGNLDVAVEIELAKGWKINADAPSELGLYAYHPTEKLGSQPLPKLIATFTRDEIATRHIALPKLETDRYSHWRLQGTLYYCEDKDSAQCLIKSFNIPITAKSQGRHFFTLKVN